MSPRRLPLLLLPAACLCFAAAYAAPAPASASAGTVVTVTADRSSALSPPHSGHTQVTYTGHVVIHRGTLTLHGDRAVVHTNAKGIERVTVTGTPARFSQKPRSGTVIHGEAETISYAANDQVLTLDGHVRLTRPGESFSAAHASYDLKSRRLSASGSGKGRIHAVLAPSGGSSQ